MNWLWLVPLGSTLLGCAALLRTQRSVVAEAHLLAVSARRIGPLADAITAAAAEGRDHGSTIAAATHRYTPRHG